MSLNNKPSPFGIRCVASRASSNPLRFFSLLGCRPISLITSHAHSEFATLLPHGRLAPYNKKEDVTS